MKHIAKFLFLGNLVIVPLYLENSYINASKAHAHIYWMIFALSLIVYLIVKLVGTINGSKKQEIIINKINSLDVIIISYLLINIISTLCSDSIKCAFWGDLGWSVGLLTLFSATFSYFIISRYYVRKQNDWLLVIVMLVFLFIMCILQSARIDVFDLFKKLAEGQEYIYMTTIGYMNWYVGFLCLFIPTVLIFYMMVEHRSSKNIYALVLFLFMFQLVFVQSDAIYVGMWFMLPFFMPFVIQKSKYIVNLGGLVCCFSLVELMIYYLPVYDGKVAHLDGISKELMSMKMIVCLLLSGILILVFGKVLLHYEEKKGAKNTVEYIKKIFLIIVELAICFITIVGIVYNVLIFDHSWGSNRGEIWSTSWDAFLRGDFQQKLIGVGPEMLKAIYEKLSEHFYRRVLVAHSEPIQILLTNGVLGFVCWLSGTLVLLISYFKNKLWKKKEIVYFLPLMAYLGQSLLNSATVTNVAILFVILALFRQDLDMMI